MSKKKKGEEEFNFYYSEIYGNRWESLHHSCQQENRYYTLNRDLKMSYFLDPASVEAADTLPVNPGDSLLDMCSAPGGKLLITAPKAGKYGSIVANDISSARRGRLAKVVKEYLPDELMNSIRITGHNASRWGLFEQNIYDAVLLDAPCSSERHLINHPELLKQWSRARIRHLSIQQFSLLAAALDAVKPGGYILYSTCSLAPDENDGVIKKLEKKRKGKYKIIQCESQLGEKSEYGITILPDTANGCGPIYYTLIQKLL